MKIYISADIEGVTGITHWDEARKNHADYPEFRGRMTREVLAACNGAIAAGADEILIKDAHGTGRNIDAADLPACASLIRGWSGHPLGMVQELDESFDAVLLIGYHSRAGAECNPLAHTMTGDIDHIKINGDYCSEFRLHAYAAALFGVPVAFVSGDAGLAEEVTALNGHIHTLAVSRGVGNSTLSIAPALALQRIEQGVAQALREDGSPRRIALPDRFTLELRYNDPTSAYRAGFYPGAAYAGNRTVRFDTDDYFDVLRMLLFTL